MRTNPKQICLLGATYNTSNMGVSALTTGTVLSIMNSLPNTKICLLDYNHTPRTDLIEMGATSTELELINIRFSKKFYLKNNIAVLLLLSFLLKFIPFKKMRNSALGVSKYMQRLDEVDLFLAISGGDSFSDIYGIGRLLYVGLPQILVILMGKPLIQLPQTIGPYKTRIGKIFSRFILKRSYLIYARDQQSMETAGELLNKNPESEKKLRFSYDMGFAVDPVKPEGSGFPDTVEKAGVDHRIIGLNISGLLSIGGYDGSNPFGLKFSYHELMRRILDQLLSDERNIVLLVPHVFGSSDDPESDITACRRVYLEMNEGSRERILFSEESFNEREIKYMIGMCEFFIGSRMHACIASLSQCIPAVAISYSRKFLGVYRSVGMESLVADPTKLDLQQVMEIINKTYENRNMFRAKLEEKIPVVRETVLNIFGSLELE